MGDFNMKHSGSCEALSLQPSDGIFTIKLLYRSKK